MAKRRRPHSRGDDGMISVSLSSSARHNIHRFFLYSIQKGDGTRPGDYLTKEFLRKYMHFAKNKCRPALSEEAMTDISEAYTTMRSRQVCLTLSHITQTLLHNIYTYIYMFTIDLDVSKSSRNCSHARDHHPFVNSSR
jgi:DNA replicative helicase MCM subunit Mcm2 (Cdc46/Mcm family)